MLKFIILILISFAFVFNAGAQITFPHSDDFSTEAYSIVNEGTCGTVTYTTGASCYGGSGGCVKIVPPTSGGQCTMGITGYNFTDTKQLNVRFLVKIGNQYEETATAVEYGYQNKMLIVSRSVETSVRGMGIFERNSDSGWYTWGACEDNSCLYYDGDDGYAWPHANDTFKSSSYADQWVCVEWELDITEGLARLYIWTADGVNNGLHQTYIYTEQSGDLGYYTEIQAIGGFFNGYHTSNANAYLMFDNLVLSNTYIGPPAGFIGSTTQTISGGIDIKGGKLE